MRFVYNADLDRTIKSWAVSLKNFADRYLGFERDQLAINTAQEAINATLTAQSANSITSQDISTAIAARLLNLVKATISLQQGLSLPLVLRILI